MKRRLGFENSEFVTICHEQVIESCFFTNFKPIRLCLTNEQRRIVKFILIGQKICENSDSEFYSELVFESGEQIASP